MNKNIASVEIFTYDPIFAQTDNIDFKFLHQVTDQSMISVDSFLYLPNSQYLALKSQTAFKFLDLNNLQNIKQVFETDQVSSDTGTSKINYIFISESFYFIIVGPYIYLNDLTTCFEDPLHCQSCNLDYYFDTTIDSIYMGTNQPTDPYIKQNVLLGEYMSLITVYQGYKSIKQINYNLHFISSSNIEWKEYFFNIDSFYQKPGSGEDNSQMKNVSIVLRLDLYDLSSSSINESQYMIVKSPIYNQIYSFSEVHLIQVKWLYDLTLTPQKPQVIKLEGLVKCGIAFQTSTTVLNYFGFLDFQNEFRYTICLNTPQFILANYIINQTSYQNQQSLFFFESDVSLILYNVTLTNSIFNNTLLFNAYSSYIYAIIENFSLDHCMLFRTNSLITGFDTLFMVTNLVVQNFTLDNNMIAEEYFFGLSNTKLLLSNTIIIKQFTVTNNLFISLILDNRALLFNFIFSNKLPDYFPLGAYISDLVIQSNSQIKIQAPNNNEQSDMVMVQEQKIIVFIHVENVNSLTILNSLCQDNGNIGFINSEYLDKLIVNNVQYGNSILNTSIIDGPFLVAQDHSHLVLVLNNSIFYNKTYENSVMIDIKTVEYGKNDNSFDSFLNFSNVTLNNIVVRTSTPFHQASSININSLQKILITMQSVHLNQVKLISPQKVLSIIASGLLVQAPFSIITINASIFENFITQSKKGPNYINCQEVNIYSSTFLNSNFLKESYGEQDFLSNQGGFMTIYFFNLTVIESEFRYSLSYAGAIFDLYPLNPNSCILIDRCLFNNSLATDKGGCFQLSQTVNNFSLIIKNSVFINSFSAYQGGILYIFYEIPMSTTVQFTDNNPLVQFINNTLEKCYSSTGGMLYGQNIRFFIEQLHVIDVDINILQSIQPQFDQILFYQASIYVSQIGPLIYLQQCQLNIINSTFDKVMAPQNQQYTDQIVLLETIQNSQVYISGSQFTTGSFKTEGYIRIIGSTLTIEDSTFFNISYVPSINFPVSSRLLQNTIDINKQITNAISLIIVGTGAKLNATKVTFSNNVCSFSLCFGGAILLKNSINITINNSTFLNNSAQYGGAISILQPRANIRLYDTIFQENTAISEGGGIFISSDLPYIDIVFDQCQINNNSANYSGGIAMSYTATALYQNWTQIYNSTVKHNKAQWLAGGISYTGMNPLIDSLTSMDTNIARTKFGQNKFSSPQSLQFAKKSMDNSTLKQIEDSYDSKGLYTIKLKNQSSGQRLLPALLNVLDEEKLVIDNEYQKLQSIQISLNVELYGENKPQFQILSLPTISFYDYFNLSDITIAGIPQSTATLKLQSPNIYVIGQTNTYYIQAQVELRSCIRGEVYNKIKNTNQIQGGLEYFFECKICQSQSYSLWNPQNENPIFDCKKCMESGVECPGGDVLVLKQGYWRFHNLTDQILYCKNKPDNCLGGSENFTCSEGHIGPLCESCDIDNGYTRAGNYQCASCGDVVINAIKVIGLMLFQIISTKISVDGVLGKLQQLWQAQMKKSDKQKELLQQNASIVLKLFITYLQIIGVLTSFDIKVPSDINSGVDVVGSPTTQVIYSFECFFHEITEASGIPLIYISLIFGIILPIVCILIFLLSGVINYRNDPYFRSFYIYTSMLYCLLYFQPSLFKDAVNLLSCRDIGGRWFIQYNILYECNTDEYFFYLYTLILPLLFIIVILIPFILLWRIKQNLNSILGLKKFSFLIQEYKKQSYYWEFVKMYIKLCITYCLIYFEYDIPNKILFIFLAIAVYGFLLIKAEPYKVQLYTKIDILSTVVITCSVYLGLVAYVNNNNFGIWISAIFLLGIINIYFIYWCLRKLFMAYMPVINEKISEGKATLIEIQCFRNCCCFKKNEYILHRWKQWLASVAALIKSYRLTNTNRKNRKITIEKLISHQLMIQLQKDNDLGKLMELTNQINQAEKKIVEDKTNTVNNTKKIMQVEDTENDLINIKLKFEKHKNENKQQQKKMKEEGLQQQQEQPELLEIPKNKQQEEFNSQSKLNNISNNNQ